MNKIKVLGNYDKFTFYVCVFEEFTDELLYKHVRTTFKLNDALVGHSHYSSPSTQTMCSQPWTNCQLLVRLWYLTIKCISSLY